MSKNDITGDNIISKANTDAFRSGHDRIFGKKDRSLPPPPPGYTAEELERDNPYNQWMYEAEDSHSLGIAEAESSEFGEQK